MSDKKKDLIQKLEEALKQEVAFDQIIVAVKELKTAFVALVKSESEKQLKSKSEEAIEGEEVKPVHDEMDQRFTELMTEFNQRKKEWDEHRTAELARNLDTKKRILEDLEKLVEEEQHIGHAFEKLTKLKEEWNATGAVPSGDYKELQRQYSHVIERFFYQINIYKTLKEYDLKKNLQLKLELTEKVKSLITLPSLKEVRDLIGTYVREWDEIGPTYQNQWEQVRDDFWENVRQVHKRISDHYKHLKESQHSNLEKKEELCKALEELVEEKIEDLRQSNRAMKRLNEIREEWKKVGFAGKNKNDQIWKRFKKATDDFFKIREGFNEGMKEVFKENEERKIKLIEAAEKIKDSMDWKGTSMEMKKLQDRWKRIPPASQGKEQKLWKRFRAVTNHFFDARKAYFDGREEREKNNLVKKEALLKKLKSLKVEKGDAGISSINELSKDWNEVGYVPVEQKEKIEGTFKKLVAEKLKESGKKESEVKDQLFSMKVEGMKSAQNSEELIRNEYNALTEKLQKIESGIKQYENNLGFFGSNVKDNPLVKEVLDKMEASKADAEDIRAKIKMLVE